MPGLLNTLLLPKRLLVAVVLAPKRKTSQTNESAKEDIRISPMKVQLHASSLWTVSGGELWISGPASSSSSSIEVQQVSLAPSYQWRTGRHRSSFETRDLRWTVPGLTKKGHFLAGLRADSEEDLSFIIGESKVEDKSSSAAFPDPSPFNLRASPRSVKECRLFAQWCTVREPNKAAPGETQTATSAPTENS